MAESRSSAVPAGLGRTLRRDAWWMENIPVIILLADSAFTLRCAPLKESFTNGALIFRHFTLRLLTPHTTGGRSSPALLILAFPSASAPPATTIARLITELSSWTRRVVPWASRRIATIAAKPAFPFILQNLHRYFLYGAIVFLGFLWYDAIRAFWFCHGS